MAPISVATSNSSRLSQFGLYRSIDSRTEEFLKLSRRRQLRQGCACAAVSTVITVTVVVVLILVYQYGMVTSETALANNGRKPLQWQIVKDSKDEGAMKIISKQAENKLKRARFVFLQKDKEASTITEAQPALKDIEEYSYIKKYFHNIRNLTKLTNRTFPLEYKAPRMYHSRSLIKKADIISKFRKFQPLETQKKYNNYIKDYKIDKSEETEYNKKNTTTSTTQASITYSVKRNVKVTNTTSINKDLFTDKQNIRRNKTKTIESIHTQNAANNVSSSKSGNKLLQVIMKNNKVFPKAEPNSINVTVNLRNASPSSLKSTIESQITQYINEYELCNNKDLLRHFLDKIILNCKKSTKTKTKCKMACCNNNKTSSDKSVNETSLDYNGANTTTKKLPSLFDKSAGELLFQNDLKYLNSKVPHLNMTSKRTTIPGKKARKILSNPINSQNDKLAKNDDLKKYANMKTNINIFKTTNIITNINNTFKYYITPKTNTINLKQNQSESLVEQFSDVLNKQVTTTEVSTNSKGLSFSPLNMLYEDIDVLDKGIGLTNEDGMNDSPSNVYDYFLPQKDYDHQEVLAKAIRPTTAAPADLNNYENVNGYKYIRLLANLKTHFDDVGMNQSAYVHVSPQKLQNKQSSYKYALFKPHNHTTGTAGELRHIKFDDAYKTVINKDDDDEKQSQTTNKPFKLNNNFKTFKISKQFSVHSTTARNIPLLYHAIKTLPFINMYEEATNEKAKINESIIQSINTTKLNNVILGKYAKIGTDEIKPETVGAYISQVQATNASNESKKKAENKTAHYTTETPNFRTVAPENSPSMDKWISYKDNIKDQKATFSTEAVRTDLLAKNIRTNELIEQAKGPINDVMHQQVFSNEMRINYAAKQIQPRVNYSANLVFHIAPTVNDNKVFKNILNANKIAHETEVAKFNQLNDMPQLNAHEVMEKKYSVNNSNAKGEKSKDVLMVDDEQQVNEFNMIKNVPLEIINIDAIDDIIQIKSNATNFNSTQTIKPKSSNIFTELREITSSIKQKAIDQQSADFAVRAPELSQAKTDSGCGEISQETKFLSENSDHVKSAICGLVNIKVGTLNTKSPKIVKQDIYKLFQTQKPYSEENGDSSQLEALPETTTHAQVRSNVCEKCVVSQDRIRKVNSMENSNNLRGDISNTKIEGDRPKNLMQHNFKFLQPLKSLEAFQSATKIEDTTTDDINTKILCDECDISEEKGKPVDSAETMDYLNVESLGKKRNLESIKEKRLDLNKIVKPLQSYHLRAGLPSYLEIVRNDFSNSNSNKEYDNNSIEDWL